MFNKSRKLHNNTTVTPYKEYNTFSSPQIKHNKGNRSGYSLFCFPFWRKSGSNITDAEHSFPKSKERESLPHPQFKEKSEIHLNPKLLLDSELKKDPIEKFTNNLGESVEGVPAQIAISIAHSTTNWKKITPNYTDSTNYTRANSWCILPFTSNDESSSVQQDKNFLIKKQIKAEQKREIEKRDYLEQMKKATSIVVNEKFDRNIILIGKPKNGKSTAINVLQNPFKFVEHENSSSTDEVELKHFTVAVECENQNEIAFNINLLDTPGVYCTTYNDDESDSTVDEICKKCIDSDIRRIHAIFFVVPNGAVNIQDIEALERFIKLFAGVEEYIHIVVSKCEKLSQTDKGKLIEDFQNYPQMKDLLKKVGQQIYFTGAVENIDFEKGFVDTFKYNLNNVIEMRDEMFNFIFQQENAFELNFVDKVRANADALLKTVESLFENKDSIDNIQILADDCVKLRSWLPVLDAANHAKAKTLLNECGTFVNDVESKIKIKT
jgi:GTP-binding protein EngB required for normal cell division